MRKDGGGYCQTETSALNYIESTRLENRRWAMGGDAMSKEVPAEAPLDEPEGE